MALAMMFAATAFATEVGVSAEKGYTTQGPKTKFDTVEVSVSQAVLVPGLDVVAKASTWRDEAKSNASTGQLGLKYAVGPVYAKAGLGKQLPSGANSYGFYTYGGGIASKLAVMPAVGVLLDVERTKVFNAGNPSFTTYKAGADYTYAKAHTVGLNLVRRLGQVDTIGAEATYALKF